MNATRWPSLTEFAKHLGREGICRVEDNDKGLHIAWIDSSPEALRRQEVVRKKERQDKGDEEREQQQIRAQIERAEVEAEAKAISDEDEGAGQLKRGEGAKIVLDFSAKIKEPVVISQPSTSTENLVVTDKAEPDNSKSVSPPSGVPTPPPERVLLKMGMNSRPKNVFAGFTKKNVKATFKEPPKKPMSESERIMKDEIELKRTRGYGAGPDQEHKRLRLA